VQRMLTQSGMPGDTSTQVVDYLLTSQSVMLSTNQIMSAIGFIFIIAATIIWLAPKPTRAVEPGAGGH